MKRNEGLLAIGAIIAGGIACWWYVSRGQSGLPTGGSGSVVMDFSKSSGTVLTSIPTPQNFLCGCGYPGQDDCPWGSPGGHYLKFLVDGQPYCLGEPVSVGSHHFRAEIGLWWTNGTQEFHVVTADIDIVVLENEIVVIDPWTMTWNPPLAVIG